jgi:hypothetical protein
MHSAGGRRARLQCIGVRWTGTIRPTASRALGVHLGSRLGVPGLARCPKLGREGQAPMRLSLGPDPKGLSNHLKSLCFMDCRE